MVVMLAGRNDKAEVKTVGQEAAYYVFLMRTACCRVFLYPFFRENDRSMG